MAQEPKTETFRVNADQEFRFEVNQDQTCLLTVIEGTAEIFGTELALSRKYKFSGTKMAVFTWHGCTLSLTGAWTAYTSEETPMIQYVNTHYALEERRKYAEQTKTDGPRVLICGPTDSGKTTLSKVLLGYAARCGRRPVFADLDVGQGSITVPGCISAVSIDRPIDPEEEFNMTVPACYWFGHAGAADNPQLYRHCVEHLAEVIQKRFASDQAGRTSGVVINTMGWITDLGYDLLRHAIDTFRADVIVVLNSEKLYAELSSVYASGGSQVIVTKLAKSGGVVERSREYRRASRFGRIREYFYGASGDLSPHTQYLSFDDVSIYRCGGGFAAPSSALPVGQKSAIDPLRLMSIMPSHELVHGVLAVIYAQSPDELLNGNVAGFVQVTEVDVSNRRITVMAPSPGHLPSRFLVAGSMQYLE